MLSRPVASAAGFDRLAIAAERLSSAPELRGISLELHLLRLPRRSKAFDVAQFHSPTPSTPSPK